jgi:hypothetical protein
MITGHRLCLATVRRNPRLTRRRTGPPPGHQGAGFSSVGAGSAAERTLRGGIVRTAPGGGALPAEVASAPCLMRRSTMSVRDDGGLRVARRGPVGSSRPRPGLIS